eukprot:SAG31_NODE_30824_length_375_cov_1.315217_1_plen_29_part_01
MPDRQARRRRQDVSDDGQLMELPVIIAVS